MRELKQKEVKEMCKDKNVVIIYKDRLPSISYLYEPIGYYTSKKYGFGGYVYDIHLRKTRENIILIEKVFDCRGVEGFIIGYGVVKKINLKSEEIVNKNYDIITEKMLLDDLLQVGLINVINHG